MNLVLGVTLLWIGSALIWVATHQTGAATPWDVYGKVLRGVGGEQ